MCADMCVHMYICVYGVCVCVCVFVFVLVSHSQTTMTLSSFIFGQEEKGLVNTLYNFYLQAGSTG